MSRNRQKISNLTLKDGSQNGKEKDIKRKVKKVVGEKLKVSLLSISKKRKMFLQQGRVQVANKLQNKHQKKESDDY
jgi:hypothetical protein